MIIPAIIGAVGALAAAAMSAKSDSDKLSSSQQFTRDENQINRDWQEKMWNAANTYNSPLQQIARFRQAGMNPNLVFGQGGGSLAASYGNPNTSNSVTPPYGSMKGIGDAFSLLAQLSNMESENKKNDSETERNKAEEKFYESRTTGQDLENIYNQNTLEARETYVKESVNLQRSVQALNSQSVTESIQRTYESSVRCQDYANQMINRDKITDAQVSKYNSDIYVAQQTLQHTLNLMDAQTKSYLASSFLSYCQGGYYNAAAKTESAKYSVYLTEADLNTARCTSLGIQNKFDLDNYNLRCKKLMMEFANGLKSGKILDVTLGIKGQEFEMAKKENKIYYLKQGVNMVTDLTNAAANVAGAASGIGGVALGFARLGQQSVPGSSTVSPPPSTGLSTYIQGGGLYY